MSVNVRAFFLSLTIFAMLVISAVGTIPVLADDGIPTGTSEQETATTESTDPGQPPASEEQQPEVTTPILEQLPEETSVAIVNEAGEVQPLVSQESAEAVLLSDPIWCPEGQTPTPGLNGCTSSYSSFTQLLSFLKANEGNANYQQAGIIYVQQGVYLGGESSVDFNSYNFTNINQHNLTIRGGWDTQDNSLDAADTSSFTVPITIGSSSNPWVGSLTLNNLVIGGVGNQTGLTLYTQGNLSLTNVQVTESLNGASLNAAGDITVNDSRFNKNKKTGANITAGGNVTVTGSQFDQNGSSSNAGKGLNVNSGQTVTLADVEANNNQVFGASVQAVGTVTATNSFFSGNQVYTYKCQTKTVTGGYGLQVVTDAGIALDGVTASDNYFFGATLDGASVAVYNSSFNDNGEDKANVGKGLDVISDSYATLIGVTANENGIAGANVNAVSDVSVYNSFFAGNKSYTCGCNTAYYGYGLQVVTKGTIFVSEVTAAQNNLFGAHLEGADVIIYGSKFNDNGSGSSKSLTGKGLEVKSSATVSLSNVEANGNQLFGANIQAVDSVSISNGFFNGNKVYSYSCKGKQTTTGGGYGLLIATQGDIALDTVEATNNYLYGAKLTGNKVSVTTSRFSGNGSDDIENPVGSGLEINSSSDVSLTNVEANHNQEFGVDIEAKGYVSVNNSFFTGTQSYEFTCHGQEFHGYGLQVVTTGNIALNYVEANENNLWGANLIGSNVFVAYSQFNNNVSPSPTFIDDTGLMVKSGGMVSLYEVQANENRLIGADIDAAGDVFISNSDFSRNQGMTCYDRACKNVEYHGYGLNVFTSSNIYLDSVTANENNLYGATLEGAEVSILNSFFNNNGAGTGNKPEGKGLVIVSSGKTSLEGVEANYNKLFGANIQAGDDVVVTSSFFNGNKSYTSSCKGTTDYGYGIQVVTTADVTMSYTTANENRLFGASISGNDISIKNSSFNNNGTGNDKNPQGKGLEVVSTGNTSLLYVEALENQLFGANIQSNGDATVTGSIFAGNKYATNNGYGLKVYANGDILLNADSDGFGVEVYDNGSTGTILEGFSNITVENSSFHDNGASGLYIKAHGSDVTLTNVTATNNGLDGVDVESACTNVVYVNGGTFADNTKYGIKVVNASMDMDGAQTFSNNPSGNVFNDRTTCFVSTGGNGNNHSGNNGNSHNTGGNSHQGGYGGHNGSYRYDNNGHCNGYGSYRNGDRYCR
jgi:hypothetical protein